MIKINKQEEVEVRRIGFGDMVSYAGEFYLAIPIDKKRRIMFLKLQDDLIAWNSDGIKLESGEYTIEFDKVKSHFNHDDSIVVIPRTKYQMTVDFL